MALPIASKQRASATFNGLLLIGLGILFFTNTWWPGILLVIGIALAVRQFLRGRYYDTVLSIVIFAGLFIGSLFNWSFSYFVPVLFTLAGIYLLYSEWGVKRERWGKEEIEDGNCEIEDAEHPE